MQSRRWLIVVAVCIGLFALLTLTKVLQIREAIAFSESFPEQSETVEVAIAQQREISNQITALGSVIAPQWVELRNEIEGRISHVGFASGARVSKGQLLLQFDASEEEAQLAAARAEAQLSQQALQRYSKLIKTNASSKDQYDQALAQNAVAVATAQALQARIDKKTLRAPFDAQTGLHQLEVGQFLGANTMITQLVGLSDSVWVDFQLPQHHAQLAEGATVNIRVRGRNGEPLAGKVIARDAVVSQSSRNLRFRASISDAAHVLVPGSAVDVLVATQPFDVVTVPATALRYDASGNHVYVIRDVDTKGDNGAAGKKELRAAKRAVTPGAQHDAWVVISEGLAAGERVAANGSYKLRDGMLVNVAPVKGASAGEQP